MRQVEQAASERIAAAGGGTDDSAEKFEDRSFPLSAGAGDRGEDFLSGRASGIAIAAEDLAIGNGRTNGMIGRPARGFEPGFLEKQEEFVAMTGQMVGELHVDRVREAPAQQPLQSSLQPADRHRQAMSRNLSLIPAAAQPEGISEKVQDRTREAHGSSRGPFQDRPTSSLDMSYALLMLGLLEKVVRHPSIVNHVP